MSENRPRWKSGNLTNSIWASQRVRPCYDIDLGYFSISLIFQDDDVRKWLYEITVWDLLDGSYPNNNSLEETKQAVVDSLLELSAHALSAAKQLEQINKGGSDV